MKTGEKLKCQMRPAWGKSAQLRHARNNNTHPRAGERRGDVTTRAWPTAARLIDSRTERKNQRRGVRMRSEKRQLTE